MTLHLTTPAVVLHGGLISHHVLGGRRRMRDIMWHHPAVESIAHDQHLDVAYLADGHEADAHELAVELAAVLPQSLSFDAAGAVITRPPRVAINRWLTMQWDYALKYGIAWRTGRTPAGIARRQRTPRVVSHSDELRPGAPAIEWARAAFRAFGFPDLSRMPDKYVYAEVNGPVLITPLRVAADPGGILTFAMWLPVKWTAETRDECAAAVERINQRLGGVFAQFDAEHAELGFTLRHELGETPTLEAVNKTLNQICHLGQTVGPALATVALGFGEADVVDEALEVLFA